ncbi:MAG: endolytic transglycosylase MltG [Candidatus Paceibacterota bacterium]
MNYMKAPPLWKKLLVPGVIFLILAATIALFWLNAFGPSSFQPRPKQEFIVKLNEPQDKIIERLKKEKIFRNKTIFLSFLRGRKIQAGGYLVSPSMWPQQLVDVLTSKQSEFWVQVPEGLRNEEIVDIFAKELNWDNEQKTEFLANALQGSMFPETYLLKSGIAPKEAAKKMLDEFSKKTKSIWAGVSEKKKKQTLIIASLLQRESYRQEELPIIAGILQNRLNLGQRLQIDATVQYVMGTSTDWWPKLVRENYKIDSPYNTYVVKGLPPEPICNPSLPAISAALNPETTDQLYYMHDKAGYIHTSRDFAEHLENTKMYLR